MYAIIISSLIYAGAFIYPNYLGVGVLFWMLPLIVTSQDNNDGFKAGCTWGLIFFSAHLCWVAKRSIIAYIAIVCYFSMISGIWLWFKKLIEYRWVRNIQNHNGKCAASCCTWIISTVTFICLTCYCSMAIFDCFEGYPLVNPLLPIVSWTWYMRPICYFGTIGYWIIIVVANLVLARLFTKFDSAALIFLLVLVIFPALFQPLAQKIIMNKNDFFYIQPSWNNNPHATASEKFYAISRKIDAIACHNKSMKYIVLPEGSFDFNLMEWKDRLDVWTSLLPSTTSIFIGAYRKDGDALYNSLYHIQDGIIIDWYDKQHRMFFGERQPWIAQFLPSMKGLFGEQSFTRPQQNQSKVTMEGFIPMICSELFCQEKRPSVKDSPILFICHDDWFEMQYARNLAYRCAQLYSLRYQMTIVYVGSCKMHIINY